jgi:hypothetical protein
MRLVAIALFLAPLLAMPVAADTPVSAAASVDRRGVTVGDRIGLTLVVEISPGYQITDTGVAKTMGEFEILDSDRPQLTRLADGRTRFTFRYRMAAFRVGDLIFPRVNVAYQGSGGEVGVAPTAEIPIIVTSVIQPGESTDDVKPLKPQLRLPGAAPQIPPLAIQAALALVVVAMLVLIVRQARRAARRAREGATVEEGQLTPAQRAMAELNRVAALRLPEKGRYAEHYGLVSNALRVYVRDRFGLAATERTPRELRDEMLRAGIDRTEIATIYDILRDGEVARFHRTVSYPARAQHAVRAALDAMKRAAVAEQYELMRGQPS